jgi:hypothetical protein
MIEVHACDQVQIGTQTLQFDAPPIAVLVHEISPAVKTGLLSFFCAEKGKKLSHLPPSGVRSQQAGFL